ncbi:MAG: hypothetical protein V3R66_00530 [Rhodospirillales bacterium]
MIKDWLFSKVKGRALHVGAKEVEKFVDGLQDMDGHGLGTVVAVAAVIRYNFETHGVIPKNLFFENTLSSPEVLGISQMKINKLARKFTRMGRPVDYMGAMVWSYTLRCLNVPELRPLGARMWSVLSRGFPYVGEALKEGEEDKGEPFAERIWEESKKVPFGFEPR